MIATRSRADDWWCSVWLLWMSRWLCWRARNFSKRLAGWLEFVFDRLWIFLFSFSFAAVVQRIWGIIDDWEDVCARIRRELEIVAVLFYWQGLLSRSNFILFEKFCCHYFREFFRIWYFDTFIPLITLCTAVQQYWLVSKIRFSKILQRPFFEITIKRHYFAEQRHSLRYSRRSHDFPL